MTRSPRVTIVIEIDDPADSDPKDTTGLTNSAYERLTDALSSVGSVVSIEAD